MSLESYEVSVRPFKHIGIHNGLETVYQVTVKVDGEQVSHARTTLDIPPHLNEVEFIGMLTQKIVSELRKKHEV